ncbi:MAG: hypothetical protein ACKPKO_09915, partial [Candidatus Fonsibacter sp.]
ADDRLGYRRNDGGARHRRLQHTAGRQDIVPLSTLQVRAQELLQRAIHRDPIRVKDGGKRRMATPSRVYTPT